MSFGGYRHRDHDIEPTVGAQRRHEDLICDGIKVLRTYKVHLPHASNVLKAISELKKEDLILKCMSCWAPDRLQECMDLPEPDHNAESEK